MKIKRPVAAAMLLSLALSYGIAQTKDELPAWSITASKFTLTDVRGCDPGNAEFFLRGTCNAARAS